MISAYNWINMEGIGSIMVSVALKNININTKEKNLITPT